MWQITETTQGQKRIIGTLSPGSGSAVRAGRSPKESLQFGANDRTVSRCQLEFLWEDENWWMYNRGHRPAKLALGDLDGLLRPEHGVVLCNGLHITFGETALEFAGPISWNSRYTLRLQAKGARLWPLSPWPMVVGSDPATCDAVASDEGVSRQHISVAWAGQKGQFVLQDLASKNGVFIEDNDQDGPVQVTRSIVPLNQAFSFGHVVGTIETTSKPRRRVHVWLAALVVALLACYALLGKEGAEPPPARSRIVDVWQTEDTADRHAALLAYASECAGTEDERLYTLALAEVVAISLEVQGLKREAASSIESYREQVAKDPWGAQPFDAARLLAEKRQSIESRWQDALKQAKKRGEKRPTQSRIPAKQLSSVVPQSEREALGILFRQARLVSEAAETLRSLVLTWGERNTHLSTDDVSAWAASARVLFEDTDLQDLAAELRAIVQCWRTSERAWQDLAGGLAEESQRSPRSAPRPAEIRPLPPSPQRGPNACLRNLAIYRADALYDRLSVLLSRVKTSATPISTARAWADLNAAADSCQQLRDSDKSVPALIGKRAATEAARVASDMRWLADEIARATDPLSAKAARDLADSLVRAEAFTSAVDPLNDMVEQAELRAFKKAFYRANAMLRAYCETLRAESLSTLDSDRNATILDDLRGVLDALRNRASRLPMNDPDHPFAWSAKLSRVIQGTDP